IESSRLLPIKSVSVKRSYMMKTGIGQNSFTMDKPHEIEWWLLRKLDFFHSNFRGRYPCKNFDFMRFYFYDVSYTKNDAPMFQPLRFFAYIPLLKKKCIEVVYFFLAASVICFQIDPFASSPSSIRASAIFTCMRTSNSGSSNAFRKAGMAVSSPTSYKNIAARQRTSRFESSNAWIISGMASV